MNYPVWEITALGGGTLIAVVSIVHVYVAHFAVGGGIFIWIMDKKASRDNNNELRDYLKRFTGFFLLLTMVFGAVTGVWLWITISLVNPSGTSALVHNFVFIWAIEWVFFLCEIIALLVYYYRYDALEAADRNRVAFIYAAMAWLSLFAVNGILAFMLTPGGWIKSGSILHAFFNPTFFPSLFFRTFLSAMIAGIFSFLISLSMKEPDFRASMMRQSKQWVLYPVIAMVPSALWNYFAVPEHNRAANFSLNPQGSPEVTVFFLSLLVCVISSLIIVTIHDRKKEKALTAILITAGLFVMGAYEYARETARKPFVISGYMYSSSVLKSDMVAVNTGGFLKKVRWARIRDITEDNEADAGKDIFRLQCLACHTINGMRNDIVPRTKSFSFEGLLSQLTGQGRVLDYMPPFMGTGEEKRALAVYIYKDLQGKELPSDARQGMPDKAGTSMPKFTALSKNYMILAWSEEGMRFLSDCDSWFILSPPGSTLEAVVIKKGAAPSLVQDNITLTYAIQAGLNNPAGQVRFWDFTKKLLGKKINKNTGITGNGLKGAFVFDSDKNRFRAGNIPVVPYPDSGGFNPYPVMIIEARDKVKGTLLASTAVVAPVSTEVGCGNCHAGGWKRPGSRTGIADETAVNILKAHDRVNKTNLYKKAAGGDPRLCRSCHDGKKNLGLSAAVHGFHANYMTREGADACAMCHPTSDSGSTRFYRDIHKKTGLTCVECHGDLDRHAAALLRGQSDKKEAMRLMKNLTTGDIPARRIAPRKAWDQEPDCLTCHSGFTQPQVYDAFNIWNREVTDLYRNRGDNMAISCPACHGSAHALYPAVNPFVAGLDVIQPVQYAGTPFPIGSDKNCALCHGKMMGDSSHHENMIRYFRNRN